MTSSTENHQGKANMNEEEEACVYALHLAQSSALTMILNGAIELDLFEIISKQGRVISPSEIASHLPTQNPNTPFVLDRMLYLLATYSLITCTIRTLEDGHVERLYGLAPAGKFFVRDVDGGSFVPFFTLSCQKALLETLHGWKDIVLRDSCAKNELDTKSLGIYTETNSLGGVNFNTAMTEMVRVTMKKVLNVYNGFEGIQSLVDIGGGNGTTLNMIISKYPSIKGINFDLPHVIEHAPSFHGIEIVSGDMFESIPKGEVILLKHILHNWSDGHCLKLLNNCYKSLPENGRLIIIESVLSVMPETNTAAKYVSLLDNVMVSILDGKERTKQEFVALCKAAGFSNLQFVCCVCTYWVMEVYK